jgi:hypothetical protein
MKRDAADDLPVVGSTTSSELGVRPGFDVAVDPAGDVVLDGGGMSVVPGWRVLDPERIPRRLRLIFAGASGANTASCFTLGQGPFQRDPLASGLELIPDAGVVPAIHGVVAPAQACSLAQYQSDLQNTRAAWQIDEV